MALDGVDLLIEVEDLTKHYVSDAETVRALDEITCAFPRRKMTALQGASGSGKSTLLNLVGALDRPTRGAVRVGDVDVSTLRGRNETAYRRDRVGFVFQDFSLIPYLTALENVMLPMELISMRQQEREERAGLLLRQVGIPTKRHDHRPARLSGGQQQRVAIARALANRPSVILADEPTANLDSMNGRRIVELLRQLCDSGHTVLIATHNASVARACDLIVDLKDGRVVDMRFR